MDKYENPATSDINCIFPEQIVINCRSNQSLITHGKTYLLSHTVKKNGGSTFSHLTIYKNKYET